MSANQPTSLNRHLIVILISASLFWVLGVRNLAKYLGVPVSIWTLGLVVLFFWLGALYAWRRNRAK